MEIDENKVEQEKKTADTSSKAHSWHKKYSDKKELKEAMTLQIRTIKSESVSQKLRFRDAKKELKRRMV